MSNLQKNCGSRSAQVSLTTSLMIKDQNREREYWVTDSNVEMPSEN